MAEKFEMMVTTPNGEEIHENHEDETPAEESNTDEFSENSYNLHHAICVNKDDVTECIKKLKNKPVLDAADSYGHAPLHYAAKYGHYDILECLLEYGADPNVRTQEESTVLHILALHGSDAQDKIVQIKPKYREMLSEQVTLNDCVKCNPLHLACRTGNSGIFDFLLEDSGLSKNIIIEAMKVKNEIYEIPLHEACRFGDKSFMEKIMDVYKLCDNGNLDSFYEALIGKVNKSPFHVACRGGSVAMIIMFFEVLVNVPDFHKLVNLRDNGGKTPLHYASALKTAELAKVLKLNHARIEKDDAGRNPLHVAARMGRIDAAKMLLEEYQDQSLLNEEDDYFETPIFFAARYKQKDMVVFLLERGARSNLVNKELHTPFLCAAIRGYTEVCKELIDRGVSVKDVDANGKNFVHMAAERNHAGFLEEILGRRDQGSLNQDSKYQDILNSADKNSNTPLHLAAKEGHSACVEVLLNNPAVNREAKNKDRWTAMHFAAANGYTKTMEFLLQKSCRFLAEDTQKNTPFHLCCQNGHYEATKLLLLYQIGFHLRNKDGRTPLDLAAENGHEFIVKLLFKAISEISPDKLDKLVNPLKDNVPLLHLTISGGHLAVVEFLLNNEIKKSKLDICHPVSKMTPIESAIKLKHESIAMAIIKCDDWKDALNCKWVSKKGTSPFKELIKDMPVVAHHVLNQCTIVENPSKATGQNEDINEDIKVTGQNEDINEGTKVTGQNEDINEDTKVTGQNEDINEETKVTFDFDYIEDRKESPTISCDETPSKDNKAQSMLQKLCQNSRWSLKGSKRRQPLQIMVQKKKKMLLDHPLTVALLNSKWKTFGGFGYLFGLIFYTIFVIFLTSFALVSPNPKESTCLAVVSGEFGNLTNGFNFLMFNNSEDCIPASNLSFMEEFSSNYLTVDDICSNSSKTIECGLKEECGMCGQADYTRRFSQAAAVIIFTMAFLQLVFEVFQFLTQGWIYLCDYTNYIDWILFICTCIFSSSALFQCVCPRSWQWQVGNIAVFLAWIDLLIFLRMLPLGIHILMFEQIFKTFWTTILLTVTLVVAFSLAFFMTFYVPDNEYSRSPFSTGWRSHVKVMAMTTGEIDFNSLFRLSSDPANSANMTTELPFLGATYPLWILFLILMPILLSNLLTGLAIYDVKEIKMESEIRGLELKIEFLLNMERILLCFKRHFRNNLKKITLDKKPSLFRRFTSWITGIAVNCYYDEEDFKRKLKPQEVIESQTSINDVAKRVSSVEASNEEIVHNVTKIVQTVASMESSTNNMKKMMDTVASMESSLNNMKKMMDTVASIECNLKSLMEKK